MMPPEYLKRPFWEIPKREASGDADVNDVYRSVGYALSQWEWLEIELSGLFAILVESPSAAASRAYGALASATARADALDRAAEIYFANSDGSPGAMRYYDITKVVKDAAPRRNDTAHGIAVEYARADTLGGGHFLVPAEYNSRRTRAFVDWTKWPTDPFEFTRHGYAYTSAQITEFGERFRTMAQEVQNFCRTLREDPERQRFPT